MTKKDNLKAYARGRRWCCGFYLKSMFSLRLLTNTVMKIKKIWMYDYCQGENMFAKNSPFI